MARFVVRLGLISNRAVIAERVITRTDAERAILFAQKWLHESRKSTRVLWMWFDLWEIWETDENGTTRCTATGEAEDHEAHHPGYKPSPRRGVSKATAGIKRGVFQNQHDRGRTKGLTPYQTRMQQMLQAAKDKASDGTVSRMGSNTHD